MRLTAARIILAFLLVIVLVLGLVIFFHVPWTFDYRIDFSSVATFMAVIVALGVALEDAFMRRIERRHSVVCFKAYHRPVLELLLRRIVCCVGVIKQYRSARLGQQRPYDHFKFSSLVIRQDVMINTEYVLSALPMMSVKQAEKFAYVLGVLPKLKSDFESLAMMGENVPIDEKDQDLIKSIVDTGEEVISVLTDFIGLTEDEVSSLVDSYIEVINEGGERRLVKGRR